MPFIILKQTYCYREGRWWDSFILYYFFESWYSHYSVKPKHQLQSLPVQPQIMIILEQQWEPLREGARLKCYGALCAPQPAFSASFSQPLPHDCNFFHGEGVALRQKDLVNSTKQSLRHRKNHRCWTPHRLPGFQPADNSRLCCRGESWRTSVVPACWHPADGQRQASWWKMLHVL